MKNFFRCLLILFLLSSCKMTKGLWSDYYTENVKSFLVSSDGKYIAFLGAKYDYIFIDHSGRIRNIFFWQNSSILKVDPETSYFGLNSNNEIRAVLSLKANRVGVSAEDAAYLRSFGFKDMGDSGLFGKIELTGRRYLANADNARYAGYYSLTNPYSIRISYSGFTTRSAVLTARNLVLTPITMSIDAVMVFGRLLSETD